MTNKFLWAFQVGLLGILAGCSLVRNLRDTTQAIEDNRYAVVEATAGIRDNYRVVVQSTQVIEANKNAVAGSTGVIKDNQHLIQQSNEAIRTNRELIEESNQTIRKNAEAVSDLTAKLTDVKWPTGLLAIVLGAVLIFFVVPVYLMVVLMWKILRQLKRHES